MLPVSSIKVREAHGNSLRKEFLVSETNTVSPLRQRMIEDMAVASRMWWEFIWRSLRCDEVIRSGGEVNELSGRFL